MLVEGARFGDEKIPPAVKAWDDPRLFTLVGLRRRGIPAKALLSFVEELGVTDSVTLIQLHKFEGSIRRFLERIVPRIMLVLDPIKVIIDDVPNDFKENLNVPFDPKNPEGESRTVTFTKEIYIDASDFREVDSEEFFRLAPGKIVGLQNASFTIRAKSFEKNESGKITVVHAEKGPKGEKPKAFIHWVGSNAIKVQARQYNALFDTDNPNELEWKSGDDAKKLSDKDAERLYWKHLNPRSEIVFDDALIEPGFKQLRKGHSISPTPSSDDIIRFQALRTAYFCVDIDSTDEKIILNQIVSLKEDKDKAK